MQGNALLVAPFGSRFVTPSTRTRTPSQWSRTNEQENKSKSANEKRLQSATTYHLFTKDAYYRKMIALLKKKSHSVMDPLCIVEH